MTQYIAMHVRAFVSIYGIIFCLRAVHEIYRYKYQVFLEIRNNLITYSKESNIRLSCEENYTLSYTHFQVLR